MNQQTTSFTIPSGTSNIVVFVHGFGVRWDSRGMYTDIQASLPKNWGSVLFDFYTVEGNQVHITPLTQQVTRLSEVINETRKRAPQAKIHIIAHSKGCIITALAQPDISGQVIFLAPPEIFGTRLEKYFTRYPGATITETEIVIPRKDGTLTHIPLEYFKQTQKVDAENTMSEYAKLRPIQLLQTTEDEVIGKTRYKKLLLEPKLTLTSIAADHNFTGSNRRKLLQYIKKVL